MIGIACGRTESLWSWGSRWAVVRIAVQGDGPVESRACGATRGDRDDLDAMATVRQGVRQVADMVLLPTGDWGIELGSRTPCSDSHAVPPNARSSRPTHRGYCRSSRGYWKASRPGIGDRPRGQRLVVRALRTRSRGESKLVTDASPKLPRAIAGYRDDEPLVRRRAMAVVKHAARSVVRAPGDQRRVVLIFGCQRSGTTMLQQTVLDRSWRVLIIEEHDRRVVGSHHEPGETAWQDYATVVQRLRRAPVRSRRGQTSGRERRGPLSSWTRRSR